MRYLFGKAPTAHTQGKASHTVATVQHTSVSDKATFQGRCVTWCFKAKAFFFFFLKFVTFSQSNFCFPKIYVCDWGNFSSVFFHPGSPSYPLFLPSEPPETTLPRGNSLFLTQTPAPVLSMVNLKIRCVACQFLQQKGPCFQICTETYTTALSVIWSNN